MPNIQICISRFLFPFSSGDIPLDLTCKPYLSVDWKNNDKLSGYVLVQSKEMVNILFCNYVQYKCINRPLDNKE